MKILYSVAVTDLPPDLPSPISRQLLRPTQSAGWSRSDKSASDGSSRQVAEFGSGWSPISLISQPETRVKILY